VLTLVDDSYNANPDSMRAALEVLAELPGPRLMVMGDMGEVGDQGPQFHDEGRRHARARALKNCSRWASNRKTPRMLRQRGHSRRMDELAAAVLAELPNRQRAGQGLALHEDGTRGASRHGPRKQPNNNIRRRGSPCCLVWPSGSSQFPPSSGFSGCSST
jgi:hypothetical protein